MDRGLYTCAAFDGDVTLDPFLSDGWKKAEKIVSINGKRLCVDCMVSGRDKSSSWPNAPCTDFF